ncbi:MAG: hypothetical protein QM813_27900 [Verrucomicrobiota bacterium]
MKFTLRLGDGRHLTRENAWACFSSNLGMPGCGSLLAGRKVGYPQLALALIGFTLTTWFGLKLIVWGFQNLSELLHPTGDPLDTLLALWREGRWALAGLGIFGTAWLWAMLTGLNLLRSTRSQADPGTKPPVIH